MTKLYSGSGRHFQEIQAVSLDQDGLEEIQLRVKLQPHFLGEALLVIGEGKDFGLPGTEEIHEILALDTHGRTVIISIVVGVAHSAHHIDTRALRMAAHVASLTTEELGKITREFIHRPQHDVLKRGWEESGVEMTEEAVELTSLLAASFHRDAADYAGQVNLDQRMILVADGFTSDMVDVIQWLAQRGVSIQGIRYKKYLIGGQEIFFAEQVVPMVDPAVDAKTRTSAPADVIEPWRIKGRQYYLERLSPTVGSILDELLNATRDSIFATTWSNKFYFWLRGGKRNLRVRTYYRDHLEIGFHNITPAALEDFLRDQGLEQLPVYSIGGYADSPFIALSADVPWSDAIGEMLCAWLSGAKRGKSGKA